MAVERGPVGSLFCGRRDRDTRPGHPTREWREHPAKGGQTRSPRSRCCQQGPSCPPGWCSLLRERGHRAGGSRINGDTYVVDPVRALPRVNRLPVVHTRPLSKMERKTAVVPISYLGGKGDNARHSLTNEESRAPPRQPHVPPARVVGNVDSVHGGDVGAGLGRANGDKDGEEGGAHGDNGVLVGLWEKPGSGTRV